MTDLAVVAYSLLLLPIVLRVSALALPRAPVALAWAGTLGIVIASLSAVAEAATGQDPEGVLRPIFESATILFGAWVAVAGLLAIRRGTLTSASFALGVLAGIASILGPLADESQLGPLAFFTRHGALAVWCLFVAGDLGGIGLASVALAAEAVAGLVIVNGAAAFEVIDPTLFAWLALVGAVLLLAGAALSLRDMRERRPAKG